MQGIAEGPLVHHIILFACAGPQPDEGVVFDCIIQDPDCNEFLIGWVSDVVFLKLRIA
jgi:hypothetical protein